MKPAQQSLRFKLQHRSPIADHEWYREPAWSVEALIAAEPFRGVTLDPCCGTGTVPDAFAAAGLACLGNDIVDRADGRFPVADVMDDDWAAGEPVDNVVTNPPFSLLLPIIDASLERARHKVAVLARLAFLETPKRKEFFLTRPLARVHVFSKRVNMPPAGRGIKETGGTVAFAWFVFDKTYRGPNGQSLPPQLGFIP